MDLVENIVNEYITSENIKLSVIIQFSSFITFFPIS